MQTFTGGQKVADGVSEFIRKSEVDEKRKETRLQGLKDHLAVSDDPEAEVLRKRLSA
jgi:hypothetical protein